MRTAAKMGMAGGAAAAKGGRFRHGAPAFATAPAAADSAPLVSAAPGEAPSAACAGGQLSSWELGDWEFADWRDDAAAAVAVVEETAAVKPRLVFAPPSREEAEEATTELRDAIER
jgi:hypothetical protein